MLLEKSNHTEEELLSALAANDKSAFSEIYHRYWELLLGIAYNRLKNLQSAEDVVHDVFAGIWTNRHRQEIQSLRHYLATAVKYQILKEARKAAVARSYRLEEMAGPGLVVQDRDAILDNRQMLQLLSKEVDVLPEKCRLIFRYSREQGLTVREIAETMEISPKTVENQLNKALHRLRLTLRNLPFFSLFVLLLSLFR